MRKVLIAVLITGCMYSLFATDARVLTMGRSDAFFMDDISVFRNPANVSIYPNMLMGSMGVYKYDPLFDPDSNELSGLKTWNRDPQKPFFGGILSYSLNQSADAGDQYPMLSLGMVFNRYDKMLDYITPGADKFFGYNYDTTLTNNVPSFESPLGKFDLLVGLALKNGVMIGGGAYVAFQKITNNEVDKEQVRLVKGNVGVNWPVAKTMDLEVSMNVATLTQIGMLQDFGPYNSDTLIKSAENEVAINADIRLFSALSSLNGDFVPHLGFEYVQLHEGTNNYIMGFNGGVGINVNIDRGFFWAGLEMFYQENKSKFNLMDLSFDQTDLYGGKVSFGIERNIIWDWFVWRVGATKRLAFEKVGGVNGTTKWIENAEADASDDDHVAFGFGLNIENRLKVDAVMAEDIFYTFTNLISGNHHHITTRITATYSF